MRLLRPDDPTLELEIIRDLLEIGRAAGFAVWVEPGLLAIRSGLLGDRRRLCWAEAGQLVILWHLGRRAGAVLDEAVAYKSQTVARKPAVRASVRASAASQNSRRRA